jgi:hypothetical protein
MPAFASLAKKLAYWTLDGEYSGCRRHAARASPPARRSCASFESRTRMGQSLMFSASCRGRFTRKRSAVRQPRMPQCAVVGLLSESDLGLVRSKSLKYSRQVTASVSNYQLRPVVTVIFPVVTVSNYPGPASPPTRPGRALQSAGVTPGSHSTPGGAPITCHGPRAMGRRHACKASEPY